MALTTQNTPTPTTTLAPQIAPGASDPQEGGETYVVAELKDGKPVAYLHAVAAKEFAPEPTFKLTDDVDQAWTFPDEESAQEVADVFNSDSRNPHLDVIPHP
jgi:hypothetical protein